MAASKLLIIDVSNYLFRAFFSVSRSVQSSSGQPANAVFGLANALVLLRTAYPDAAFACVFDAPGPTFRHKLDASYKATRKPLDEDLRVQIEPCKQLVSALGMQMYCVSGVEADDVIATSALAAVAAEQAAVVASSDKDLMYLASRGVQIHDPRQKGLIDSAGVTKKFKVRPEQMTDYLVLVGDSSDNVAGVPGIGPKRASELLARYETLDGIVANQDKIKGAVGNSFREAIPKLDHIKNMIVLREDVELDPLPTSLGVPEPDHELLASFSKSMNFSPGMQKRLLTPPAAARTDDELDIAVVQNADQAKQAAGTLARSKHIGVHIETQGMDGPSQRLVGIGIAAGKNGWYVPAASNEEQDYECASADAIAVICTQLEKSAASSQGLFAAGKKSTEKAASSVSLFAAKPAVHAMHNQDLSLGVFDDIHLLAYSVDSNVSGSLEQQLDHWLLARKKPEPKPVGTKQPKPKKFAELGLSEAAQAACSWAQDITALGTKLRRKADSDQQDVYNKLERPLVEVLKRMEQEGILVDKKHLEQLDDEFKERKDKLEEQIANAAGASVNLNSPQELAKLLYGTLKLATGRKTSGGHWSTNVAELERLAANSNSPVPDLVLAYRHIAKLQSTYTASLPGCINSQTGRVHTSFDQTGAVTGRLASKNPNLQNIPVRDEDGKRIRECFVAKQGTVLLSADYSQIELRILAHFSQDPILLAAFEAGEDVHSRTAADLFDTDVASVTADQRRFAKTINFGLIYGMGRHSLAKRLGIPFLQAQDMINRYFERLGGVSSYMEAIIGQDVRTDTITVCGRKIKHADSADSGAVRAAMNAPMQGSAADIMKLAMIEVDARLASDGFAAKMLLQIHDELVFEVPSAEVDALSAMLNQAMTGVIELKVPLAIDIGTGPSWADAH